MTVLIIVNETGRGGKDGWMDGWMGQSALYLREGRCILVLSRISWYCNVQKMLRLGEKASWNTVYVSLGA